MDYTRFYSNLFNNSNLNDLPIKIANYDYKSFINTPNIFQGTSNIGIGTDNPKYNLDVIGTIKCSNLFVNNKEFNIVDYYTSNNYFNNTIYWNKIIDIKSQYPINIDINNKLKLNYDTNVFYTDNQNNLSLKCFNDNKYTGKILSVYNINNFNLINTNISNLLANNSSNVKLNDITNVNSILNLSNTQTNSETMIRFTDNSTGFNSNNGFIFGKNNINNCLFWNYFNSDIIFRISENNLLYSIFQKKTPWGLYFAEDYDSSTNILYNYIRTNDRNATCSGTISKFWGNGNGANCNITYLTGNTSANINFGSGSLPTNFTVCSLTRYNGATRRRIMMSSPGDYLQGHWNTFRGVCHYNGWKTIYGDRTLGNQMDWLCCIGRNNNSIPTNIICDGIPVGGNVGGIGNFNLTVNTGNGETSDWAFSLAMVWDQFLTDDEVFFIDKLVNNYMNRGISIRNLINKFEDCKIANNGNIGLGVINPQSLLEVNGHITTKRYYYSRTTTAIPSNATSFTIIFSNLIENTNMDSAIITYTSDNTNGDYFTIKKTGLYLINVILGNSNSNSYFWIDKNKTSISDCLQDINTIIVRSKGTQNDEILSFRGILDTNDIIRIKSSPIASLITSNRYTLNISFLMEVK